MTDLDSIISEDGSEASLYEGEKYTENVNSTLNRHSVNNMTATSECLNVASSGNTMTNTANFAAQNMNTKVDMNAEEYARKLNYFNMQNNAYLKARYTDGSPGYYGWIPGMNSMRMPALIYPHSFMGFAPTVAWMKTNGHTPGQAANIEKVDRWRDDLSGKSTSFSSEESQVNSTVSVYAANNYAANNSDEDEGLVLDEREISVKRRRHKDGEKLQTQTMKALPERSSVIQENMFIQAKPAVTTAQPRPDATSKHEQSMKQTKRGRASTRKIEKTDQYWDRRKKNNVSAKKSRDARRQRETVINQRSSMMETENLRLRAELATLREENTRVKQELNNLKKT